VCYTFADDAPPLSDGRFESPAAEELGRVYLDPNTGLDEGVTHTGTDRNVA
jgi:hypothetical protein